MLFVVLTMITSCKKWVDPSITDHGYPKAIDEIITNRCATSGCHSDKSFQNAGGLNLTNWSSMLQGGSNGSVVIPYSPEFSSLKQFINTYADLGTINKPTMPIGAEALTREEVNLFVDWIKNGCKNKDDQVPFAASTSKMYISNQGCDVVSVIDAASKLAMRFVKVGHEDNDIELPHNLQASSDGKYWYACFVNGKYFQKFNAATDHLEAEVFIGTGSWNVIKITPDNQRAYLTDFTGQGKLVEINLNTMTVISSISGPGVFVNPHGIELSKTADTLYITSQFGNMIYRYIPKISKLDKISLQKNELPVTTPQLLDPHEVLMSPDFTKYFITCQASNEVRVMDAKSDTLLAVIPVGTYPLEMAISKNLNRIYVTCQEDANPVYPFFKGSVYAINMNTLQVEKIYRDQFYQPHGISVDSHRDVLYVASRNADPNGPAPHHVSNCGGRNGYYTVIDLKNNQVIKSGFEISSDPYSICFRP